MRIPSSPWSTSVIVTAVTLFAISSCGGIQEKLETLRAEHIEIVDTKGAVKMDVEKKIATLEERVQKLEALLEKRQEASPIIPVPTPPAASGVPSGVASGVPAGAGSAKNSEGDAGARPPRAVPRPAAAPGTRPADVF